MTVANTMLNVLSRRPMLAVCVGLFAASLALYVATLAPGLTWANEGGDGGDFLTAAHVWGIPHPTGYPTYILLLRGFTEVFRFGDEALRGNLMSAFFAAGTIPFVFMGSLRVMDRVSPAERGGGRIPIAAAAFAAVAFAVSSLHWSQATITEVYSLNAFFAAVFIWLALETRARIDSGSDAFRWRVAGALILAIGLGNHATLLFLAGPFAVWALWPVLARRDWRGVLDWRVAGAFLFGLGIYSYTPIASAQDPVLNWGLPHTGGGFRWMIGATIYQRYAFGVNSDLFTDRIVDTARLLLTQYTVVGTAVGVVGLTVLASSSRGLALAGVASSLAIAIYAITYNTLDSFVYLIPVFMIFAGWMAVGAANLFVTLQRLGESQQIAFLRHRPAQIAVGVFGVLALAVPGWSLAFDYGDQDLSSDTEAADFAEGAMVTAGDSSVVMADGLEVFALWYQSIVAEPERDILIISVPHLQFDWYWDDLHQRAPDRVPEARPRLFNDRVVAVVQHNLGIRPVWMTNADRGYSRLFSLVSDGDLFRVEL